MLKHIIQMKALHKLFYVLILGLLATPVHAYTVEMSQTELQAMVEQGFPIRQQTPFATTVLSQPKITIPANSQRLRLSVAITAVFPNNITSKGRAEIEGELDYDATKGEFHLREPSVTALYFDNLPQQYRELLTTVIGALARQTLPIIVIYRLDEKDLRQSMAKRVLKDVKVRNGKLIAELDW